MGTCVHRYATDQEDTSRAMWQQSWHSSMRCVGAAEVVLGVSPNGTAVQEPLKCTFEMLVEGVFMQHTAKVTGCKCARSSSIGDGSPRDCSKTEHRGVTPSRHAGEEEPCRSEHESTR